jgi:hypothetical protein
MGAGWVFLNPPTGSVQISWSFGGTPTDVHLFAWMAYKNVGSVRDTDGDQDDNLDSGNTLTMTTQNGDRVVGAVEQYYSGVTTCTWSGSMTGVANYHVSGDTANLSIGEHSATGTSVTFGGQYSSGEADGGIMGFVLAPAVSSSSSSSSRSRSSSSSSKSSSSSSSSLRPAGTVCWGHDTGVLEAYADDLSTWTGTGTVIDSGDNERLHLDRLEKKASPVINPGTSSTMITYNKYKPGLGTPKIYYRTGATEAACTAASWTLYTPNTSFDASTYVQVQFEGLSSSSSSSSRSSSSSSSSSP